MNKTFLKAVPILEKIEEAGFEAYFVGGSVRDYLLHKEINDVDIASSATPLEIKSIFRKTVDVGIEHGTVLVLVNGEGYEITTFRTESGYSDFRRPDTVEFVRSLEDDLKRRDFTMNAIAMDKQCRLIDPFHGKKAILEKRIVTVGEPGERFREDALRMMRALRFVSQLSFELDAQAFESLRKNSCLLENIAVERIYTEFEKLLMGKSKQKALKLLTASGLYTYLPGLASQKEALERFQSLPLEKLTDPVVLWTLLLTECYVDNIETFLRKWKIPVKQIREIQRLLIHIDNSSDFTKDRMALFNAGVEEAVKAARIIAILGNEDGRKAESSVYQAFQELPIQSMIELAVNGNDLISWFDRRPGPWVKEELMGILEAVLNGEVRNRKEAVKEWLKHCKRM
ncbi:CCA tRNA nucleotidyltransferase [Peribacillus cavernae]|uniref:CCA-adding enzyme n=1 Tax=Peribacillus cavernae TaxID=1674310 RepID=A0A433HLR6_9BACI|nr:CCA tRNA nucleotidyltransferase [Peribacillus cavernae]MDQ0218965.1 tRNA nucleotidyltransferase (CCA-adding enzyme) [Peribacillus cavernae]RUQ29327.1 CCA tRNA nucleotidyltransferase [Peribacillus cavernae]